MSVRPPEPRLRHRCLRSVPAVAAALVALAVAAPASADVSPIHWKTLTPGTSSSVRSTTYNHGAFKMTLIAYFGQVTSRSLFLDKLTFKYTMSNDYCIFGGKVYVWNSGLQLTYAGDEGVVKCNNSSYTRQVDRWFVGGQTNGKAFVAVEKNVLENYWCTPRACAAHRLRAAFYVP